MENFYKIASQLKIEFITGVHFWGGVIQLDQVEGRISVTNKHSKNTLWLGDKNTSKIIKSGYLRAQKLKSMMLRNRNNGSKLKDSINVKEYIKEAENDYV